MEELKKILKKLNNGNVSDLTLGELTSLAEFIKKLYNEKKLNLDNDITQEDVNKRNRIGKTLQETFGDDYQNFIYFLLGEDKETIKLFKIKYGENLNIYIRKNALSKMEDLIIEKTQQEFIMFKESGQLKIYSKQRENHVLVDTTIRHTQELNPVEKITKPEVFFVETVLEEVKDIKKLITLQEIFLEEYPEFINYLIDLDEITFQTFQKVYGENLDTCYNIKLSKKEEKIIHGIITTFKIRDKSLKQKGNEIISEEIKSRTLIEIFGSKYKNFIKHLTKLDTYTIKIFKEQYGENFDTYNANIELTNVGRSRILVIIEKYLLKIKRNQSFTKSKDENQVKDLLKEFNNSVYQKYGKYLDTMFPDKIVVVKYLISNYFNKIIEEKPVEEIIALIRSKINELKNYRGKIWKDSPLSSELVDKGFDNPNLNHHILENQNTDIKNRIKKKYGYSLKDVNVLSEEEEQILNNFIIPLLVLELKQYYKVARNKTLSFIFGSNVNKFYSFVKKLDRKITNLFKIMYGEHLDIYNPEHNLSEHSLRIINIVIDNYQKEIETRKTQGMENDINERNNLLPGDTVKLKLEDCDGLREICYYIADSSDLYKLTKYTKLPTYTSLAKAILSKEIGTTFFEMVEGKKTKVTILDILEYSKKNIAIPQNIDLIERINNYVASIQNETGTQIQYENQ